MRTLPVRPLLPSSLLAVALLHLGCASTQPPRAAETTARPTAAATASAASGAPAEDFRAQQPSAGPPVAYRAPVPRILTTRAGLTVWLLERHEVPLVSLSVVLNAGANTNPRGLPGLSSFVAQMLDQGTTTRQAMAIAREFENLAAVFQAQSGPETLTASVSVPSEGLAPAVSLLADVVRRPAFRPADVERIRKLRSGEITQALADPVEVGRNVLARVAYGEAHPWAYPTKGTLEANRKISRAALVSWHRTWVQPRDATLVVVGDVTESTLLPLLEAAFQGWTGPRLPTPALPRPRPPGARTLVLVDRADGAQSQVWIGSARGTVAEADLYATRLANAVLGGGPKGRLFRVLRTAKAYSYGAYSGMAERRQGPGLFFAAGGVVADKTPEAVQEFVHVLDGLATEGVTNTDLAEAKSAVVEGLPARFESNDATASAFASARGLGFSPGYFAELPGRVQAVSRSEADAAARAHFSSAGAALVVVGPMKALRPRLEQLGLGPVQVRDPSGKLLSRPRAARAR